MKLSRASKRLARVAVNAATIGCLIGFGVSVANLALPPAEAAENAGSVAVIGMPTPDGASLPLDTGGSDTPFRFKIPDGSTCSGDSANDGYRIQSYMVPQSVVPETLRFDTSGPVPVTGQFRAPMYGTDANPFVSQLTAMAVPAGGPGGIIQPLVLFDYAVYDTVTFLLPAGVYNVGIACTLGVDSPTQLDKYWNTVMTITADPADTGPAKIKWEVTAAAASTTTTLSVGPGTTASAGTEVTLTAAVTPTTALGSVTFKDGSATLGTATVTNGSAVFKTKSLAVGARALMASFAPTMEGALAPSVSTVVTYTVTAGGATTTSITSASSFTTPTSTSTALADDDDDTGPTSAAGSGNGLQSAAIGGELPRSGGTFFPLAVWSFFLICFGRAAVLLGRRQPSWHPGER